MLKLALRARTTWSRSNPIDIISSTVCSYVSPVTSRPSASVNDPAEWDTTAGAGTDSVVTAAVVVVTGALVRGGATLSTGCG